MRPIDSDVSVYRQVFGERQYDVGARRTTLVKNLIDRVRAEGDTPVIIDGGANVGYSPVFLADQYPGALVIAVEPDRASFEQLERNIGKRNVRPVFGAIWRHALGVDLVNPEAPSWSRQVADGGATPSFTIEDLLAQVPRASLVLLKLDVEGAEAEIIAHSAETLRSCPCVLIEPHDWKIAGRNSLAPMYGVLAGRRIDTVVGGENLMFFDTDMLGS